MLSLLKKGCRFITLNVSGDSSTKYVIGASNIKTQTVSGNTTVTFKGLNPETDYIFKAMKVVVVPPLLLPGEVRISNIYISYRGRRSSPLKIQEIQLLRNGRVQNIGLDARQSSTGKDRMRKYMNASYAVDGKTRFSSKTPTGSSTNNGKQHFWTINVRNVTATHVRVYGISPNTAAMRIKDDRGRVIFSQMIGSSKTQTFKLK
jgi:hypothetical protein